MAIHSQQRRHSSRNGPNPALRKSATVCPTNRGVLASRLESMYRLSHVWFKLIVHSWWINPLFAHHAGIIGLESIEGGTTYDKNGAYALLLKDTDEIDPRSEGTFTYRCPIKDKGKFRLTAATPVSRDPIRVLRSHSIKSIWAPKAGVRYEGL